MFCPLHGLKDSFSWALQARGSCFAVPLLLSKYVFLPVFPSCTLLSQKDFLHPARSDTGFVLRVRLALGCRALGGRAAGRGALWGAQVVHQRDAILPAEVNELDLSDAAVKVDTCKGRGNSNNIWDPWCKSLKLGFNLQSTGCRRTRDTGRKEGTGTLMEMWNFFFFFFF